MGADTHLRLGQGAEQVGDTCLQFASHLTIEAVACEGVQSLHLVGQLGHPRPTRLLLLSRSLGAMPSALSGLHVEPGHQRRSVV